MKSIGSAAAIGMKVFTAGVTTATTGIAALSGAATNAYADYEQLVGGIETLFGTGGQSLKEYADSTGKTLTEAGAEFGQLMAAQELALHNADKAYETAGMSANNYMETISGFAASLKQSTKTELEAAQAADQAVTDMADNANKMGTSMESIQNAYQGFAKQNYTMLDNLKLGYGGTKEEMARLLEDATKLSGVEYDINNLKEVYEAIHVIQEDLGIAGTTVKEASTTISGSMSMMKASAENLLVALADPEADISEYIDNLVESTGTFAENLLPIVEESVIGVAELIEELFPVLMDRIPETIGGETLSSLVESGINIIMALIEGIQSNLSLITDAALEISMMLNTSLLAMLPLLLELGLQVIVQLALGIAQSLPELIPITIDIILQLVDVLLSNLDLLIDAGIELILALTTGLIESGLPLLIDKAPMIIEKLLDAIIKNTPKLVDAALKMCLTIGQGILDSADRIIEKVPQLLGMLVRKFEDYKQASLDIGANIVQGIWDGISMSYTWIQDKISGWIGNVIQFIKDKLDINSPSGVMRDEIGLYMGEGVFVGFEEYDPMGRIERTLNHTWDGLQMNFRATTGNRQMLNYRRLGDAIVDGVARSGLAVQIGEREFGRIMREAAIYG